MANFEKVRLECIWRRELRELTLHWGTGPP